MTTYTGDEMDLAHQDHHAQATGVSGNPTKDQLIDAVYATEDVPLVVLTDAGRAYIESVQHEPEDQDMIWFTTPDVQAAVTAAKVAWESEIGQVGEDAGQTSAALHALTEMVIATTGLPLDVDSVRSRDLVYQAIRSIEN